MAGHQFEDFNTAPKAERTESAVSFDDVVGRGGRGDVQLDTSKLSASSVVSTDDVANAQKQLSSLAGGNISFEKV